MTSRMLRGHLDLLLLAVVGAGPKHGYAVIEALRSHSDMVFDLPEGTVYPALHRLEDAGLLRSHWDDGSGRRRRTYHLTERGRTELDERRTAWRRFVAAVEGVLQEQPWTTTP